MAAPVAELVALAKTQPGKLNCGSNGNGTAQHLIGTQFENITATDLVHVPYKGSGPLTTDLLESDGAIDQGRHREVRQARQGCGGDDRVTATPAAWL